MTDEQKAVIERLEARVKELEAKLSAAQEVVDAAKIIRATHEHTETCDGQPESLPCSCGMEEIFKSLKNLAAFSSPTNTKKENK